MVTRLVAFLVATALAGRTRPASSAAPIPLGFVGAALSSLILYTRKLAGTMGKKTKQEESAGDARRRGGRVRGGESPRLLSGEGQSGVPAEVEGVLR